MRRANRENTFVMKDRPIVLSFEPFGERIEKLGLERIDWNALALVNLFVLHLVPKSHRIFVRVDFHFARGLRSFVQFARTRVSDFDPREKRAVVGKSADARCIRIAQSAGRKFETAPRVEGERENPSDQVMWNLRGMHRDSKIELVVMVAIDVGHVELESVKGRSLGHGISVVPWNDVLRAIQVAKNLALVTKILQATTQEPP